MAVASVAIIAYLAHYDQALLERRLNAGPVAEKEKSQQLILTVTSVIGLALTLLPGLRSSMAVVADVAATLVILGNACVGIRIRCSFFWCFAKTPTVPASSKSRKTTKSVSTGPYALVRHPMYTGAILMFFATPFALGSWWALIPAVALSAMIVVRLMDEEKFLAINLPGYAAYTSQVRYRLIPGGLVMPIRARALACPWRSTTSDIDARPDHCILVVLDQHFWHQSTRVIASSLDCAVSARRHDCQQITRLRLRHFAIEREVIAGLAHRPDHIGDDGLFARRSSPQRQNVMMRFVECRTNEIVHRRIDDDERLCFTGASHR